MLNCTMHSNQTHNVYTSSRAKRERERKQTKKMLHQSGYLRHHHIMHGSIHVRRINDNSGCCRKYFIRILKCLNKRFACIQYCMQAGWFTCLFTSSHPSWKRKHLVYMMQKGAHTHTWVVTQPRETDWSQYFWIILCYKENTHKKKRIEKKSQAEEKNDEGGRWRSEMVGGKKLRETLSGTPYRKCDTPLCYRKQMANRRYTNTLHFVSLTHDMIMLMCIKKIMAQYSLKNHLF